MICAFSLHIQFYGITRSSETIAPFWIPMLDIEHAPLLGLKHVKTMFWIYWHVES